MDEPLCFALPASYASASAIGDALLELCRGLGPPPLAEQVLSAFHEAYNNVIIHGYQGCEGGALEIEVEASPGQLLLTFRHQGQPFDGHHAPQLPDFSQFDSWEELPEGGMGLAIMDAWMDEVSHHSEGDTQILTMKKLLSQPPH